MSKWLRRRLITGCFVTVPLAVSVVVLVWLFQRIDSLTGGLAERVVGRHIPGLGILATLLIVLAIGTLATNVFGNFEIPVAGKTGTAQRANEPDYALFASYAPVPNPKYVTVVVIERGGHGGVAGALTALDFYSKVFKVPEPNLGTVVDEST